jgi:hypothetical protein
MRITIKAGRYQSDTNAILIVEKAEVAFYQVQPY